MKNDNITKLFHVHGDNIVECERFINIVRPILLKRGFSESPQIGSFICPKYKFHKDDNILSFQYFPGFVNGRKKAANIRWNSNVLNIIKKRGGPLREAPDILLTEVINRKESPLLSIEYCSALQAGNQAWQRSGRAYSCIKAGIPYLYITDIGGIELSEGRVKKNPRLPSPVVTFSYISALIRNTTPVGQIFIQNSGTTASIVEKYRDVFGDEELELFIEALIFSTPIKKVSEKIKDKQLEFISLSSNKKSINRFNKQQWIGLLDTVGKERDFLAFLEKAGIPNWKKRISISRTHTLDKHLSLASSLSVGITQNDLPFCLLRGSNRLKYSNSLREIYKDGLSDKFYEWISSSDQPIVLCWVAAFKPGGQDSRPDRGLLPLCRMLLGDNIEILSIIYGPIPDSMFINLKTNPRALQLNGLWQAVFDGSDALIVDSVKTLNAENISFVSDHWSTQIKSSISNHPIESIEYTSPIPLRLGENDVDSLLHSFIKKFEKENLCYEVICNPPGGDWSGLSYVDKNTETELRWLSLPRVGNRKDKRPDHIIQVFSEEHHIILSVESKELAKSIEENIGERLNSYVKKLLQVASSSSRSLVENIWTDKAITLESSAHTYASGIAFLGDNTDKASDKHRKAIIAAENKSQSDISFTVNIKDGLEELQIRPLTTTGKLINDIFKNNISILEKEDISVLFLDSNLKVSI